MGLADHHDPGERRAQRGQRWMAQNPGQIDELADKVGPGEDSFTIIYTSGTDGSAQTPNPASPSHSRKCAVRAIIRSRSASITPNTKLKTCV